MERCSAWRSETSRSREGIADARRLVLGLPVIAYSDCAMSEVFTRRGVQFTCEFYADLDYDDHGKQFITKEHHPVAPDAAAAKVRRAVTEGLTTLGQRQRTSKVVADSICRAFRYAKRNGGSQKAVHGEPTTYALKLAERCASKTGSAVGPAFGPIT